MPQPWSNRGFASPADLAECRTMLCGGSRSFYAASFLLPASVRGPATGLYAFCRFADDAIDLDGGRTDALGWLTHRLDLVYAGRPYDSHIDRALADVVSECALPRALLDALLEGFAWDAQGRRYEDLSGIYAYSARVAGTVGAMMALLMGARSPELAARACDLGVAMQLTNIARDVGEDARNGRLYLPRQWMRAAGIDPDVWLARPVYNEALASVVQRLLDAADVLYERADMGIAGLPRPCRFGINAARYFYAEIGREVSRRGFDSISSRAVVPGGRKAQLLTQVVRASMLPRRSRRSFQALDETRFLVDAIAAGPTPAGYSSSRVGASEAGFAGRVVWVLDLFERLERRDRQQRAAILQTADDAAVLRG